MWKLQKIRLLVQLAFLALGFTVFFQDIFKAYKIFFMILAVTSGAFYCGWACPFGMIQDVFGYIGSLFIKKKLKTPQQIQKIVVYLRYLLAILFVLLAFNQIWNFYPYDARLIFFKAITLKNIKIISITILLFFMVSAMFFDRLFCNYFCPHGAKLGALSLLRIFTVKRNNKTCIHCHKCDSVCPMNIKVSSKQEIKSAQCINCFKCISNCPKKGTLKLGIIGWLQRKIKLSH